MPGIRSTGIGQFFHFRRVAMERLEFGVVVEGAARYVVDEGFRRSAVGKDQTSLHQKRGHLLLIPIFLIFL